MDPNAAKAPEWAAHAINQGSWRRALWTFGLGGAALLIPLLALERAMKRTGGPGIIAFELAGTPERSRKIMDTWGPEGQSAARLSLLLDYPLLITYCGIQVAGCAAASDALPLAGCERTRHRGTRDRPRPDRCRRLRCG